MLIYSWVKIMMELRRGRFDRSSLTYRLAEVMDIGLSKLHSLLGGGWFAVPISMIVAILGGGPFLLVASIIDAWRLSKSESRLNPQLSRRSKVINSVPGTRLLRVADFFCSPKSVELTFKPLIADLQSEYFEALMIKRKWKARWIRVRYVFSFLAAMGISRLFSFIKSFTTASK
jgi:hypothetical protein